MSTFYSVVLEEGKEFNQTTVHSTKSARDKRLENLQRQYGEDSEIAFDENGNAIFKPKGGGEV